MIHELMDDATFFSGGNITESTGEGENTSFDKNDTLLSNENLSSFITDSPFSFRNPIFFSVPRDNHTKETKPITSKRHLFADDD